MLGLKIAAPGYLIIEFVICLFQKFYSLCIGHMGELGIQHMVQSVQKPFINKGVEEVHLLRSVLQHIADHIFQHSFCHLHIVLKIRESHLRLDHPEFCRMTGSIGIFRPECRSESIDIPESLGESFTV